MLAAVIKGRARIRRWCPPAAPTPGQNMTQCLKEVRECGNSEGQHLPLGVEQSFSSWAQVAFWPP